MLFSSCQSCDTHGIDSRRLPQWEAVVECGRECGGLAARSCGREDVTASGGSGGGTGGSGTAQAAASNSPLSSCWGNDGTAGTGGSGCPRGRSVDDSAEENAATMPDLAEYRVARGAAGRSVDPGAAMRLQERLLSSPGCQSTKWSAHSAGDAQGSPKPPPATPRRYVSVDDSFDKEAGSGRRRRMFLSLGRAAEAIATGSSPVKSFASSPAKDKQETRHDTRLLGAGRPPAGKDIVKDLGAANSVQRPGGNHCDGSGGNSTDIASTGVQAVDDQILTIQRFWRQKSHSQHLDFGVTPSYKERARGNKRAPSRRPSRLRAIDDTGFTDSPKDSPRLGQATLVGASMSQAAKRIQSVWRRQKTRNSFGSAESLSSTMDARGSVRAPQFRLQQRKGRSGTGGGEQSDLEVVNSGGRNSSFWSSSQGWFGTLGGKLGQPGLLDAWWKDKKKRAIQSLLHNSAPILKRTLGDIGDLIKENTTADPDMPSWLRPVLTNLVGSLWEDVETEVMTGVKLFVVQQPGEPEDLRVRHDPRAASRRLKRWLLRWRAFVLSHYLPHDRSIWGRLKDPVYLFMTALTMLPIFGSRVFFFGMILTFLLFPGPPDEYQLINFILIFKGLQFFTTGVILGFYGAMQYYLCYLFSEGLRECIDAHGPGSTDWLASLLFDTFGSVILVWIAFLALPQTRSQWHTKVSLHGSAPVDKEEVYCCCLRGVVRKGGRLSFLMRYDLACFLGSWLFMLPFYMASSYHTFSDEGTATALNHDSIVHAKATVFWCRILYSILSLPFVIFVIPGLGRVLTHSVTTGYDSSGACLEFTYPEAAKAEGEP